MYCTISSEPVSSILDEDASAAYHRFWREARTLGAIARSFDELAANATSAYLTALRLTTPNAWAVLVTKTALLVERTHSLRGILGLTTGEQEALDFFAAIVEENADLLGPLEAFDAGALGETKPLVAV
jgi:hypothetical protein